MIDVKEIIEGMPGAFDFVHEGEEVRFEWQGYLFTVCEAAGRRFYIEERPIRRLSYGGATVLEAVRKIRVALLEEAQQKAKEAKGAIKKLSGHPANKRETRKEFKVLGMTFYKDPQSPPYYEAEVVPAGKPRNWEECIHFRLEQITPARNEWRGWASFGTNWVSEGPNARESVVKLAAAASLETMRKKIEQYQRKVALLEELMAKPEWEFTFTAAPATETNENSEE